ncbi:phenazine biosynthesis protein PhzF [Salinivibrio kushneri]|uniref:Phenazine biosynthesis protein PhzF n=1 Tax=Salinivibrio kushneri TaxID=1908198 RepID=A0AB36K0C3_9GAMM|nr:PhzF family phenazine biosynthesis protein [Salinivibrio kushneri]OOE41517.1 phenazine biosynthesis protein PhzF [Salinivibrio kushneri]QCP02067.1 PhzF family phenazine biosynthesis protein [Salinivibrio kushneri]
MIVDIYQVDAFSASLFQGNPAGVCISTSMLDEATMLSIAEEMTVSETAFLALDTMSLRWFTPRVEVALCGHGTLATAHILAERGDVNMGDNVTFYTQSGPLEVTIQREGIAMAFPVPELVEVTPNPLRLEGLGIHGSVIRASYCFGEKELLVVNTEDDVKALSPDFAALTTQPGRGVVVTAASSDNTVDIVSRYFAPWVGVNEDPVTGSAHCALAAYWSQALSKKQLIGYQVSARGGHIKMTLTNEHVLLQGQAVTVFGGKLDLSKT